MTERRVRCTHLLETPFLPKARPYKPIMDFPVLLGKETEQKKETGVVSLNID